MKVDGARKRWQLWLLFFYVEVDGGLSLGLNQLFDKRASTTIALHLRTATQQSSARTLWASSTTGFDNSKVGSSQQTMTDLERMEGGKASARVTRKAPGRWRRGTRGEEDLEGFHPLHQLQHYNPATCRPKPASSTAPYSAPTRRGEGPCATYRNFPPPFCHSAPLG